MARFQREGLVLQDRLAFVESYKGNALQAVNLRGRIVCCEDVIIKVDKWLDMRRAPHKPTEVKGSDYVYHAWLRGRKQYLIRYCSHTLEDLHCHHYDLETGEETERNPITLNELPTLGDFIPYAIELGRAATRIREGR